MSLSTSQKVLIDEIIAKIPDDAVWCIIGSTDSVLRGLDDDPSDIDVLATESAAFQFREQFSKHFIETREVGHSQIDTYIVNCEEIEVIFHDSTKSYQKPFLDLEDVNFTRDNKKGAPLIPLTHLINVYEKMNKYETAERLKTECLLSD